MKKSYEVIFENNKNWVESKLAVDKDFFKTLSASQTPDYLYIGCSDSRVSAEEMMGLKPGEVFVTRNVANVVNTLDMSATAVIQYAVEHLKVKHIIVCGHYGCGGVKAAMTPQDLGLMNPWLRNIRDVYRLHQAELDAIEDDQKRYDRLVELNVQEQYLLDEYPVVHGWVFDMRTGTIIDLEIDFEKTLKDIQKIYNLTDSDWVMSRKKKY